MHQFQRMGLFEIQIVLNFKNDFAETKMKRRVTERPDEIIYYICIYVYM